MIKAPRIRESRCKYMASQLQIYRKVASSGYYSTYQDNPRRCDRYHSDPFFLDVNSNPEHKNVTATFIDNYSQICVDFGKTNAGYIKLGIKFGCFDAIMLSGDTVRDIVRWAFPTKSYQCRWGSSGANPGCELLKDYIPPLLVDLH